MYREWKKIEFLESSIYEFENNKVEVGQEIVGKMKCGRMEN
jgi:hypothetical protein